MKLLTKLKLQLSVLLVVLVAIFAAPVLAAPAAQDSVKATTEYVVQSGDNLSHLGRRFGMHPSVIIGANPQLVFRPNVLIPGETLIIPGEHFVGTDSVADVLASDPRLSTFLIAARTAELLDDLDYVGRYTVFVPTNAAFQQLSSSARGDLLNNLAFMNTIVHYHIVPERYTMAELANQSAVASYSGAGISVTGSGSALAVNGVPISAASSIETSNGVVYLLPALLPLPDDAQLTTDATTIDFASTFDVNTAGNATAVQAEIADVAEALEEGAETDTEVLGVALPTPASTTNQALTVATASLSGSNLRVAPNSVVLSCGSLSVSLSDVLQSLSGPLSINTLDVAYVHYHNGFSRGSTEACVTFTAEVAGGKAPHRILINNIPIVPRNAHLNSRVGGEFGDIEFDVLADCNQAYSFALTVESGDGQQATRVFNQFIPCP